MDALFVQSLPIFRKLQYNYRNIKIKYHFNLLPNMLPKTKSYIWQLKNVVV